MEEARTQPGQVLADRYRLDAPLGSGGFGTIWRAQHLVLQAPVAVKLIDPEIAKDSGAVDRFMREARAAAALRSPHVVQILDYGFDGDLPFIVMELLEGENLAQRLRRLGRLSPNETARLLNLPRGTLRYKMEKYGLTAHHVQQAVHRASQRKNKSRSAVNGKVGTAG